MTKNFKLSEFLKSDRAVENGIDNTPTDMAMENLKYCASCMQTIRDFVKRRIDITSGYRCPHLNKIVGGAAQSDHMSGLAADFKVSGYTYEDHKKLMELMQKRPDVRYMKVYSDNRLHVSWK